MLVSEEQAAALEAEVAAVLGTLEALSDPDDPQASAAGVRCYAEQVERIALAVGEAGLLGLQDVCLLFQEKLLDLQNRAQLSDVERECLEEWPILMISYLASPSDAQAGEALIRLLQNPVWNTPLAGEDATILLDLLYPTEPEAKFSTVQTKAAERPIEPKAALEEELLAPSPPPQEIVEVADVATAELAIEPSVSPESAASLEEPESAEQSDAASVASLSPDEQGLISAAEPPFTEPVDAVESSALAETDAQLIEETSKSESSFSAESAVATVTQEDIPVAAQHQPELDGLDELDELDDQEEPDDAEDEDQPEPAGLGDAAQELVDILRAEIELIIESTDETLNLASAVESAPEVRRDVLMDYAEQLERMGEASASIGLMGLHQFYVYLQINLSEFAAQDQPFSAEQRQLVLTWPELALRYLSALHNRQVCTALVRYLRDSRWPQPLADEEAPELIDLLASAQLSPEQTEAPTRPAQAQLADVSLALPADVNQELLDGLLVELPVMAADFSAAIQRLMAGIGTLDDMKAAQRIAHTLKGAGNTVGVRGIATLTHYIEDILIALSKHETLPNRALNDTLLNAADCLEAMSEALLGVSAPPTHSLSVLQDVLDWANRIDREGVPGDGDDRSATPISRPAPAQEWTDSAAEARPTAGVQADAATTEAQPAASTPEATLRIPAHLVDELLRLVGESMILTGQIQERFRQTVVRNRALIEQNRLLQSLTAELEQLVDIRNVASPISSAARRGDFDPLELEQYNELNTVTHRLLEAAADHREIGDALSESLSAMDAMLITQQRLQRDNQHVVLHTRMVPIQTIVPRLQRSVRQTCRLVDKDVDLRVRGAETLIDSNVLNEMVDPLMHILRNAVDHGIESPEQRQHLGKSPTGRIVLDIAREGNNIVLRCQDDGAGLDLPAIRRIAVERGLIPPDKLLDDEELARLILLPGFSTRDAATQTSGRGVGMDVVYTRLLEMKGSMRIRTQSGRGCLMELRLPVTLISTHALLVRMRNRMLAISSRGIEQIIYSELGAIRKLGAATTFQLGDAIHELTGLAELLHLPPDHRGQLRVVPPVLLVREETGNLRAVLVEEVVDTRELVVKNLGPNVPKLNGVIGATILGDGSVVPVLDLPEILRVPDLSQDQSTVASTTSATGSAQAAQKHFVLAVDDSLSARRALLQLVRDAGFEGRAARDGLEAVEIIKGKRPDLVLTDLEMPQMNGMELTVHLRTHETTHNLPVIMITSRSTDKHRREAEKAGVNVYLTKPFQDDDLLGHIHKLLRRA